MVQSRSLLPLTFVPSLIFEGLVRLRNHGYERGLFNTHGLDRPVISVGNLCVGGTGKTPIVALIARMLTEWGQVPALLSRGYARRSAAKSFIAPPGVDLPDAAEVLGDEPALIRRLVPGIWVGIDADRTRAGRAIRNRGGADVFLLDDGFQHRSLRRDLDIVVVDRTQPFVLDRALPRGRLREPLSALARADVILLTGSGFPEGESPLEPQVRKRSPRAEIMSCSQAIAGVVPLQSWKSASGGAMGRLQSERVFVVAAVGNPRRLLDDIKASGRKICGARFLRDHLAVSEKVWGSSVDEAQKSGADCIVITEKDAVKAVYAQSFPVGVCVQSTTVDRLDDLSTILRKTLGGHA